MQQQFMLIRFAGAFGLVPVENFDSETGKFTPDVKQPFAPVGYNGEQQPGAPYQHTEFGQIWVSPLNILNPETAETLVSIAEGHYTENGVEEPIPAPEEEANGSDSGTSH